MSREELWVPEGAMEREDDGDTTRSPRLPVRQVVEQYPLSTVMITFGVGLAVGVALGVALAESDLVHQRQLTLAERIGQRVIDALGGALPGAIASRIPH